MAVDPVGPFMVRYRFRRNANWVLIAMLVEAFGKDWAFETKNHVNESKTADSIY